MLNFQWPVWEMRAITHLLPIHTWDPNWAQFGPGLDINSCVLSYFQGTAHLHCYTSCTLTTLHCSKVSFLQCCHMKTNNKIFTKMWGVYSLLWDTVTVSHDCIPKHQAFEFKITWQPLLLHFIRCKSQYYFTVLCKKKRATGFPSCRNFRFIYWYFVSISESDDGHMKWKWCFIHKCLILSILISLKVKFTTLDGNTAIDIHSIANKK